MPFGLIQPAAAQFRWSDPAVITVSDRTGDPRWHAATQYAVRAWNSSGARITLRWSEGGVGCQAEGRTVPVCRSASVRHPVMGMAYQHYSHAGMTGAYVLVTANNRLTQIARNAIATHEVGHALGLDHSDVRGALMGSTGNGTDHLHISDHQALWGLYGRR